jgi:hypothetical protein
MGEIRRECNIFVRKYEEKDHLINVGTGGMIIILKWILSKRDERNGTCALAQARYCGGSCEHGNENQGSIKGEEHADKMSNCKLLKKHSVP